ncbi:hypothetical protein ABK040_005567 [Willaertia magna]
MSEQQFEEKAYFKCLFHAMKFPYSPINGVFIGKINDNNNVIITDCVPLFHTTSSIQVTSYIEMALLQIDNLIKKKENNNLIVGYYFSNENQNEISSLSETIPTIHLSIYNKIVQSSFKEAKLWVIDNEKLSKLNKQIVLKPFHLVDNKKMTVQEDVELEKKLKLENLEKMESLIKEERFNKVIDFENHLENLALDYMNKSLTF